LTEEEKVINKLINGAGECKNFYKILVLPRMTRQWKQNLQPEELKDSG